MYLKLAWGNVRRSARDYSVYFATLAFAACLMYSFTASGDYLTALDLTPEQRAVYAQTGTICQAFSVFVEIVFIFLVSYANRFIVRRRKREFALYALLGMEQGGVARVLALESAIVGAASLAGGLLAGGLLSPAFSAVAAFVFNVPWKPQVVFSGSAARWCALCFALMCALGALACVRDVLRRPLIELMAAERTPEYLRGRTRRAGAVQTLVAFALLAIVWGSCVFQPVYFILYIIPMGFAAYFATGLLMRVGIARWADRARKRAERYWDALRPFTVRQVEARISSSSSALACTCVLIACAVCMMSAGFAFSVGLRGGDTLDIAGAMAPIGYIGIFYGASFLVAAAAILALQQLSGATDARRAYRALHELGCPRSMLRTSLDQQIRLYFAAPVGFALVHDVFGLILVGFLALGIGSSSFFLIVGGVLALTLGIMAVYYLLTRHMCARMLLGRMG